MVVLALNYLIKSEWTKKTAVGGLQTIKDYGATGRSCTWVSVPGWLMSKISVERFTIIDLETAAATEINLCDQTYAVPEMVSMLQEAGFETR